MADPNAAAAAAAAATTAGAQQVQGAAGRSKLSTIDKPIIDKARLKQMLDGCYTGLHPCHHSIPTGTKRRYPFPFSLWTKIIEANDRLKEIYIMREHLQGKGDALGEQQYQSIHEGAFKEYNPTPRPGVGSGPQPTLSGGFFSGYIDGTPASLARPPLDTSIFIPDVRHSSLRKAPGQDAVRKRIQEIATTVDPGVKIDSEAETLLLEIADEFIESVKNFACRLAEHRGSESLEIKDLQLHLEKNHNIRIPGFSNELPVQQGNVSIAAAAAPTSAGAGASGAGGVPSGGTRSLTLQQWLLLVAVSEVLVPLSCCNSHWNGKSERLLPQYFPSTLERTFLEESCGIADIITSCLGGRNRQIAEAMAKTGKSFQELEESMLQGQKLQGPQTADEVHKSLEARGAKRKYRNGNRGYPQFEAVWKVCYEGLPPAERVELL